ncbi:Protein lifeguard 1-like [Caenorhabditis elegans]|uniref:Protein lifeguard 1-like n=1 Tax=Caenorhabditis elegans TaxID=6239 RepID=Q8MQ55_CAEEL|nr:Protein lifeguard 1-like [Caenorhabditis elegans]CAD44126.1 Protein lifeguard 1-like [Caenorhabditis elegans]|eukprot:NP_505500.2 X-BoX promoter element regulated [Caenorhabditis elegans]
MSYNQQPYNPAYQNPYPNQGPPPPGFNTGDGQNQNQGGAYFSPPPPMHGAMFNQMENGQHGGGDNPDGKYSFQFSDKTVRAAFVRKVFSLVFIMLCIVAAVTVIPWVHDDTMRMVRRNSALYLGSYVIFFVTYLSLVCCEGVRRKFPVNLIVTGIFTLATSVMTMVISAHHDANVVLLALAICIGCTFSIVIVASQTKFDLTAHMGYILIISMCFMFFGLVVVICSMFFKIKFLMMVYALGGALIMMLYLFLDVQMLMGGKKYEISPEEYIFASVQIFIDIVQMFWFLLSLFGSRN